MPDTTPSPEKTVIVAPVNIGRLQTLTVISLTLNVVILVLLLLGAIAHHRAMMREKFEGRMMQRGGFDDGGPDRGGRPFPKFGGGPRQGFPGDRGPSGEAPRGPGAPRQGMDGMMGLMGGPGEKPDPAKAADTIMDHLSDKLALTDDEKTRIKPIVQQQVEEIQKQREAQRAAMQRQIEDAKAKIKPLLNLDQQKQLDALPIPGSQPLDVEKGI